jgi:hypothetical protein
MKTIAIIGSAGTNARPWTEAFLKAGWQVRNPVYAAALAGIGVLAASRRRHRRGRGRNRPATAFVRGVRCA